MPFGSVFAHGACIRSGGGTWSCDLPNLPPLLLGVIGPNPARTGADPRQHGARLRTSMYYDTATDIVDAAAILEVRYC